MISKCPGIEVWASESSPGHSRSVSVWFCWSADDFLEVSFSDGNVVSVSVHSTETIAVIKTVFVFV